MQTRHCVPTYLQKTQNVTSSDMRSACGTHAVRFQHPHFEFHSLFQKRNLVLTFSSQLLHIPWGGLGFACMGCVESKASVVHHGQ